MKSSSTVVATVELSAQSSLCNGEYRIIRKLGSGGFGITYLAYDNGLGREVAIKECFPRDLVTRNNSGTNEILPLEGHEAEFEKYKEEFCREAQILAKLPKTKELVSVFHLVEDNNTCYIIMEYLPGQPLDRYLAENGPVDPVWLLKMIKPVLEALDLVHEKGLVHRDISPDNLMLSPNKDYLTLMDFGSAVLLQDGRITHAIGKPGFAPIEQYDVTNELTAASDIYALSTTIYNLLSGHQPTPATNRLLQLTRGGDDPIVRLRSMADSISQDIEDLVFKGMQLDAKDRYQTAHEMAEAIDSILHREPEIDETPPLPEPEQIIYKIKYYYDNICDEGLTKTKTALRGSLITDYEMEPKRDFEFEKCEPQPFYNGKNPNDNVLRIYYVKSTRTEMLKCQYRIEYYFDDVCDMQLTKVGTADINSYFSINPQNEKNGFVLDKVLPTVLKVGLNPEDNVIRVYYCSVKPKRYQYRIEHYYGNKIEDSLTTVAMAELSEHIKPSEFFERDGYKFLQSTPSSLIVSDEPTENVIRVHYFKKKKRNYAKLVKLVLICAICWVVFSFVLNTIISYTSFEYSIQEDGTVSIDKYIGDDTTVIIPARIGNAPVTTIGEYAFQNNSNLTSLIIPDEISSIGEGAFSYCTSLTSITIPGNVMAIDMDTFIGCTSLTSITIPNSVTTIGYAAFSGCTSLTNINIPDSVITIEECAFSNCTNLTNITIPDSITAIHSYTFDNCTALVNLDIPEGVTTIDHGAFSNCTSLTSIIIPDSVTWISANAFVDCINLSLEVPSGSYAEQFAIENNTSYRVSTETSQIIDWAAETSDTLASQFEYSTLPDNTIVIENYLGDETTVIIPEKIGNDPVTAIGDHAFMECSTISSITIPDSVTMIGEAAFWGCTNLTSVNIPNGVTLIDRAAFLSCYSLTNITIPDSVTMIGESAFMACTHLSSITIPSSVTMIGEKAFLGCLLSTITVPSSVTTIGDDAFMHCKSLIVAHGSYAEQYAIENDIPYDIFEDRKTGGEGTTNVGGLNVRKDPQRDGSNVVTRILESGTAVYVNNIVVNSDGEQWYEINYNGIDGYVPTEYIDLSSHNDTNSVEHTPVAMVETSGIEWCPVVNENGELDVENAESKFVIPREWRNVGSFSNGLAYVEKDGKYGFINTQGKLAIPYQWDYVYDFSEGFAVVQNDDYRKGYINTGGELVIPYQWEDADSFSEGLAAVKKDGLWGFINNEGELVIPYQWENADSFHSGVAAVEKDGLYGFINTKGDLLFYTRQNVSFSEGYASVRQGDFQGFIDTTGDPVIPCQWDEVKPFSEGLAAVEKDHKWGFIDTKGESVIPCQWEGTNSFHSGLAAVEKDGLYGFINSEGELVIPYQWEYAESFSEGLAAVRKDGLYGFINTDGVLLIPYQWEDIYSFSEGLALVKKFDWWGFINTKGELVIPCQWCYSYTVNDELDFIDENGLYCFFNAEGELVTPRRWTYVGDFSEGIAPVQMKDGSYCFINTMGEIVFPYQWEYAESFSDGLALVKDNDLYGFIDTTGRQVIPCQWKDAQSFSDGIARVQVAYRYGFINTKGELITPCHWNEAYSFDNGLALVEKDRLMGFINTDGESAIPCQWDDAQYFSEGLAAVKKDGLWGYINMEGELVIPCQWEYADDFSEGLARVSENGLSGFIDTTGKLVIPCQWDSANSFSEGFALVEKDRQSGFINTEGELAIPYQWFNAYSFSEGLAAVYVMDQGWGYINTEGELAIPCQWEYVNDFSEGIAAVCDDEYGGSWYYINTNGQMVVPGSWYYARNCDNGIVQVEENIAFHYSVPYTIQVNRRLIDPVQE